MKRLLLIASLLLGGTAYADINVTEGAGKVVPSDTVGGKEYQKIKIVDGVAGGLSGAPVDPVGGISVRLTTGTAAVGSITVSTGGVTATQGGTWTVNVATGGVSALLSGPIPTGTNAIGSVVISSFGVSGSTIAVVNAAGGTLAVQVVTSTLQVQGAVNATQAGTWTVQPGNTANSTAWKVDGSAVTQPVSGTVTVVVSSFGVSGSTIAVVNAGGGASLKVDGSAVTQPVSGSVAITGTPNVYVTNPTTAPIQIQNNSGVLTSVGYQANGGSVPVNVLNTVAISGAVTAQTVNITTAVWNAAIPAQGSIIGGVGPTGAFQSFAVDASSQVKVTGSFSTTSTSISTGSWNSPYTGFGSADAFIGPTGAMQSGRVDASSNVFVTGAVTISTGGVNATQGGVWTVQPGNTPNATGWIVQTSSFGVNGSTISVTNAGGTKLLVTPDSVALPANQSVNVAQVAGTTADTNSGTKTAGTLRVILATDQPALTNKLLVTPDSVALPANQSVNVAQMNGVTTSMNTGTRDTGTQRVTIATDDNVPVRISSFGVTGSTVAILNAFGNTLGVSLNQIGGITIAGGGGSGSIAVGGTVTNGTVATSMNPMLAGIRVTSTTIPVAQNDLNINYVGGSNIGQVLVTGMPWGLVLSTYSIFMSSSGMATNGVGGSVLVSSPAANTRTYLCGCTFTNTTATPNEAVFTSPPGVVGGIVKTHFIGIPASFVPSGYRHDCVNPFFASAIASNIGIYQSQTAGGNAAIHYACTYYQAP